MYERQCDLDKTPAGPIPTIQLEVTNPNGGDPAKTLVELHLKHIQQDGRRVDLDLCPNHFETILRQMLANIMAAKTPAPAEAPGQIGSTKKETENLGQSKQPSAENSREPKTGGYQPSPPLRVVPENPPGEE